MPLPRFRLRTLMIGVAVVALPLALMVRREQLLGMSRFHRDQMVQTAEWWSNGKRVSPKALAGMKSWTQLSTPVSQWHETLAETYRQAASRPWRPVPPEPPEPK